MPTPRLPPLRLVALDGGPDILVEEALLLVGRDGRCDARIDSSRVSRFHCYLARHGDGVVVRDLGSTNGIRINGRPASSGRLRAGDELAISDFRYRLEAGRAAGGGPLAPRGPAPGAAGRADEDAVGMDLTEE